MAEVARDPITSEDVKRLAQRSSIKRVGDDVTTEIRKQIEDDLNELCYRIVVFLDNAGRSTVSPTDVQSATYSWLKVFLSEQFNPKHLKLHKKKTKDVKEGEENTDRKTRKLKPGTRAGINIRHLQKTSELIIRPSAFEKLVRLALSANRLNVEKKLSIGEASVKLIQGLIEYRLIQLLQGALNLAKHCGRETIQAADVKAVSELREHF